MPFSDTYKQFDEGRKELRPYGTTCELWLPKIMRRADRHNEIELNFLPEGTMTYLVNGRKVQIPNQRLAVFWALTPHQIIHFEKEAPYYVCTIPFVQFLDWGLPGRFVDILLKGEIVVSERIAEGTLDQLLFEHWIRDFREGNREAVEVSMQEIRGRIGRLALSAKQIPRKEEQPRLPQGANLVEKMVLYIADNYTDPIKTADIGKAVGLHPDYANSLFKKTFGITLSDYLVEQRLFHAQRRLSLSGDTVTNIAFESGFNSISRFNAAFSKHCGCSPREYRKKYSIL
ncbi:helix-turn-helix domain-containing protein [Pleomorphovibrio marinus]|uniref:helix-turn-helix domain-containing protein n=1 Tax=Pleomorphovibrio marinus TaxID=2164132 RepID=UPI000E0BA994|nr:helix-turn-helix domain-containing protein [Pleomorphovibrio marinus]